MRLLKTGPYIPGNEKLEVIQKWGKDIPAYAILSHTWSIEPEDEVLLSDIHNGTCNRKPAFAKLTKAMERAKLDGYGWLWIDTCCIDKTSSVELSEAINSMYGYYRKAEKCYTYLADVVDGPIFDEQFKTSRWWKRGWTLQELIAPTQLEFFSSDWISIGYRDSLHETITEITGVEQAYLVGTFPVEHASIAKRMSWAALRETTREEDLAYALIGIFDVNMPMLYGEGATRAFTRLQEEIMKSNEDQSLFAWVKENPSSEFHGLLADSPKDFERTGNTISYTEVGTYNPCTMTARGLNLTLPLTAKQDGTFVAALRCPVPSRGYSDWVAVYFTRLSIGTNQYARVHCDKLASVGTLGKPQEVYVRQSFSSFATETIVPYHFFQIRSLTCTSDERKPPEYKIVHARAAQGSSDPTMAPTAEHQRWSSAPLVYRFPRKPYTLTTALLVLRSSDREAFVVMLGTGAHSAVSIAVYEASAFENFGSMQRTFSPQRPGEFVDLAWHSVRVNIEERVRSNSKVCFVDIDVHAFGKPPTTAEMLQGAVDAIAGEDRREAKRDLREKVRRLWSGNGS